MRHTLDLNQSSRSMPVATDQKVGGSSPSERAQLRGPFGLAAVAFLLTDLLTMSVSAVWTERAKMSAASATLIADHMGLFILSGM
jgi:hypothetical protein